MLRVVRETWPLLGGLLLLMIGNGAQGTLLGIRGAREGFDAFTLSLVMSAYFIGFLFSARYTPLLIAKVGHIRVFAGLGSVISACFILYAEWVHPVAWAAMRALVGFGYCGLYVVVESWLNASSTNETRGQALSAYIIVQLVGIVASQLLMNTAPVEGYTLFVIISVLVSVSFIPILFVAGSAPAFQTTRPLSLARLYRTSPLGFVAAFLLGSVFSSVFGMSAVYGSAIGLSVQEITILVGTIYAIGLFIQYPLGWLSDRMDRRMLIFLVCAGAVAGAVAGSFAGTNFPLILLGAAVAGGLSNPMWSLVVAHTNDHLDQRDMAAGSGGLLFVNGLGAIGGAPALGWLMETFGPWMFFAFNGILMGLIALYALYRMTRRAAPAVADTQPFAPMVPIATPMVAEVRSEVVQDLAAGAAAAKNAEKTR
jgi:MFS family permease